MCLVVAIGTPNWGLCATDTRHSYVHADGTIVTADLGGKAVWMRGGQGRTAFGGDGAFGLAALKRLEGTDARDAEHFRRVMLEVCEAQPPVKRSAALCAYEDGGRFRARMVTNDGDELPASGLPGASQLCFAWPEGLTAADQKQLHGDFIARLQRADQARSAAAIAEAVHEFFAQTAARSRWCSSKVDGVLFSLDRGRVLTRVLQPTAPLIPSAVNWREA